MERKYQLITTQDDLENYLEKLKGTERVALDTETTGLDVFAEDFKLVGVCLATSPWEGAYIPVNHENFADLEYQPDNVPEEAVKPFLEEVFANTSVVMHNSPYDRPVLKQTLGLDFDTTFSDDTLIAMHLVDENQKKSLKELSKQFLGASEEKISFTELKKEIGDYLRNELIVTEKRDAISPKTGRKYKKNFYSLPDNWLQSLGNEFRKFAKDSTATPIKFLFDFFAHFFSVLKGRSLVSYDGRMPTDFRYLPVDIAKYYAVDDAMNTFGLWLEAATRLELDDTYSLYSDIDLVVSDIMMKAQHEGIQIDKDLLHSFGTRLGEKMEELEGEAFALLSDFLPPSVLLDDEWEDGTSFNPNTVLTSNKQLQYILYNHLGYPVLDTTASGNPSIANKVLKKLLHEKPQNGHEAKAKEFIRKKLQMADINKILTTYTYSLAEQADVNSRIHPSFNVAGTVSGRMSSRNPNFQNMPRLLPEELEERPYLQGIDIRQAMVADEGHIFVDFDYTAMEMVVCAALSNDENMRELLNNKRDLHAYTARYAFNVGHDLDDKEFKKQFKIERQNAKIVNFAVIYGGTEWTLQKNFGMSNGEANKLIQGYFQAYPGVDKWMKDTYKTLRTDGYIVYPEYGFIKHLDLPNAPRGSREYDRQMAAALRSSQNALIQGYSAYIVKDAIRKMQAIFEKKGMKSRVLFQVHDEIGVHAPIDEAQEVYDIMHKVMEREVNGVQLRAEGEFKFTMSKSEEYSTLEAALESKQS